MKVSIYGAKGVSMEVGNDLDKDTRYMDQFEARDILKACRLDNELIELILDGHNNSDFEVYFNNMVMEDILDIENKLKAYKFHNEDEFQMPSEYLANLMNNNKVICEHFYQMFKRFEYYVERLFTLYKEGRDSLERNLEKSFDHNYESSVMKTFNSSKILQGRDRNLFLVFILQKAITIEKAREWLKNRFVSRALQNIKKAEYCTLQEFRHYYSRNFHMNALIEAGLGD